MSGDSASIIVIYIFSILFLMLTYFAVVCYNIKLAEKYKYVDNVGIKIKLAEKLLLAKRKNTTLKVFLAPFVLAIITIIMLVPLTIIFAVSLSGDDIVLSIIGMGIIGVYSIIAILVRRVPER